MLDRATNREEQACQASSEHYNAAGVDHQAEKKQTSTVNRVENHVFS